MRSVSVWSWVRSPQGALARGQVSAVAANMSKHEPQVLLAQAECVHQAFAQGQAVPRPLALSDKRAKEPVLTLVRLSISQSPQAPLAQLAEHALRKRMVVGSIPTGGSCSQRSVSIPHGQRQGTD